MRVKLKVLNGGNAGKEIAVPVASFLIGRGQDCHLRPQSDLVSRKHCEIRISDEGIVLHDFGGKNGTFINGQRVDGQGRLDMGDRLKVGPLEFEVLVDHSVGGAKKPKVASVADSVSRASESTSGDGPFADDDVSGWLLEADEEDRAKRISDPETRQFKLDETEKMKLAEANKGKDDKKGKKKEKKTPGKLPSRPEHLSKSSGEAAEKMLRKFFTKPPGT